MPFATPNVPFKRKFPRRSFTRAVGFLFDGRYIVGQSVEIGEGGISLHLPIKFPIGRQGVASFQMPDGSFVCVRIEVRNLQADPNKGQIIVGCLFQNLHFNQKREIRSYVSARTDLDSVL